MRSWASASGGAIQPRPGELVGVEGAFIEGMLGMASGLVFGLVGTSLGHPADTIKTKMHADPEFRGRGALFVFRSTVKRGGVPALYRGFLPPLVGGSCFCSAVFGAYSSTFAACEGSFLMDPLGGGGPRPAVLVAAIAAAAARSVIETPFELVKTRMQLGQPWRPREAYVGGGVTLGRNVLLLGTMFASLDLATRAAPAVAAAPVAGPFVLGAVCNTAGWAVAWPLEVVKSQVQGDPRGQLQGKSVPALLWRVVCAEGPAGLWRGFVLGGTRSFVVNGCSMVAYQGVLDLRRRRGLV